LIKTKSFNHFLFILLLVISTPIIACECPSLPKLTPDYCKQFKLIFRGTVQKVAQCNEINHATFKIQELYKGQSKNELELYFDCSGDCKLNFNPGETWIIYANYVQLNKPKVDFCSRSRKLVDNEIKVATNFVASDLRFNEECDWLKENLGIQKIAVEDSFQTIDTHRNQLPESSFSLTLIIISLIVFSIIILIVKKFLK
jgi:hypothetical protein